MSTASAAPAAPSAQGRAFTLITPSDDEAIDNIQKLTGYTIPVHGGAKADAAPAKDEPREEREPRRERGARKPRGEPKRTEAAAEKPAAKPAKKAADRKPAPARRQQDDDGPDDGWNGPMPDFLSFGFGS